MKKVKFLQMDEHPEYQLFKSIKLKYKYSGKELISKLYTSFISLHGCFQIER